MMERTKMRRRKMQHTKRTFISCLKKNIWLFLASILLVKLTWSGFVWAGPFLYQVHVQRRYFLAVKYFTLCLCFIIQHLATVFMFGNKILCCAYFILMTRCRTNHMLLVPESIGWKGDFVFSGLQYGRMKSNHATTYEKTLVALL